MILLKQYSIRHISLTLLLLIGVLSVCSLSAQTAADSLRLQEPDTIALRHPQNGLVEAFDGISFDDALPQYEVNDTVVVLNEDSIAAILVGEMQEEKYVDRYFENFNPKPLKALWMAALFPGGGQIYNRKYWKLPIVYGGFLGLVYGYNFNQRYYKTYQNAYRDLMTNSPNASYLQFLPGRTTEAKMEYAQSHSSYLESTFKRKKNTYRNWRDYCVVGMLGVYLVSMVDAYVDAALYHFDVSPDLDACNNPALVVSYSIDF